MSALAKLSRIILRTPVLGARIRRRFIAGETINEAFSAVERLAFGGYGSILHYMGKEHASVLKEMKETFNRNCDVLFNSINNNRFDLSLKFSSFGLFSDISPDDKPMSALKLDSFVGLALARGIFVWIDAEELQHRGLIWQIAKEIGGQENLGVCVQSYAKDAPEFLKEKLRNRPMSLRICKGAYLKTETDIIRDLVSVRKNFIEMFFMALHAGVPRIQIATHDIFLIQAVLDVLRDKHYLDRKRNVEFAFVLGKHDFPLAKRLVENGFRALAYVPFGPKENQVDYLARRIEEDPKKIFLAF